MLQSSNRFAGARDFFSLPQYTPHSLAIDIPRILCHAKPNHLLLGGRHEEPEHASVKLANQSNGVANQGRLGDHYQTKLCCVLHATSTCTQLTCLLRIDAMPTIVLCYTFNLPHSNYYRCPYLPNSSPNR